MKKFQLLLLIICISYTNFSFASDYYNNITLFTFDASCMQKYDYEVDKEFILDDDHTAYHLRLDNERTLILKVMNHDKAVRSIESDLTIAYDCQSLKGIQPKFVLDINNGNSPVFIEENGNYYKVSYAEYNVDNDAFFSSFAPPHHSVVYEYNEAYDPLQTLPTAALFMLDYETQNFYYSTEQERFKSQFVFLQIYRDACANRPYGIVVPRSEQGKESPFKYENIDKTQSSKNGNNSKQIYRTCQHPVEVTYVKGVGLTRRSYEEDGMLYISKLVSIDGESLSQYLSTTQSFYPENTYKSAADFTEPISWEYDLTKVERNPKYAPKYILGGQKVTLRNSTKKGTPTTQPTLVVPSEYEAETVPEKSKNSVKKGIVLTVPKISARNVKHIVQQGETLYSLSKKYNISVLDIKTDNQLSENIIGIGQELIIEKKDMMQN